MRIYVLAALLIAGCSPSANFDPAKWRDADLTSRARADMLTDFLARHPLKGMSRREVIAFLGPPTTTDTWRRADMTYVLGSEGSYFAIDNEWLFIKLDRHNRVASFERGTD